MADPGDAPYKIPGQFVYEGVLYGDYVRKEILENPASVDVRKDDVFVVTYPKTGTTWTQEIMTLILNNGDFESNKKTLLQIRSPFMEFYVKINFIMKSISFLYSYTIGLLIPKSWEKYIPIPPYGVLQLADGLSHIRQMPSPILIKSHLQVKFFPPQALKNNKIVYVARNPKDTCVSFYHFYRSTAQHGFYKGPWAQFLRMFINGQADPHDAVRKMAAFVERPISEELVDAIVRHTSVKNMQTNSATNVDVNRAFLDSKISPFIRKGVVGDWENYFTVAQNDEFDRIYERRMKDTDLKFEW
ncbi:sulfotransferase 1C2-like [Saccoglossus kowalevskii]